MYQNDNFSTQYQLDTQTALNAYIVKVFGIMFAGLALTAATALYFAASGLVVRMGAFIYVLFIAEFALVVGLTASLGKIRYGTAVTMFLVYSLLNGITLSVIFYVYPVANIGLAFVVTAAAFGIMTLYGALTGTDLTGFGNLAGMLLVGGILTMVVNIFLKSSQLDYIVSLVMLVVFVGLVAYDTQKLKGYFYATQNDAAMQKKLGVHGALSLYLDFINIFLLLLRLFGRRR